MHNVYVDAAHGFGIAAPPKVASISTLDFLFRFREGREPVKGELEGYTRTFGLSRSISWALSERIPMIAVHRDPIERLRSAYQHRIVELGEAPCRSFGDFCRRLGYFRGYRSVAWHTDAQCLWLGSDPDRYQFVLPLRRLGELPALVSLLTSHAAPVIPHIHRTTAKPDWDEALAEFVAPWVAEDSAAGWDGELTRVAELELSPGGCATG